MGEIMIYKIINKSKDKVISQTAFIARSFFSRLLGLMFRKSIAEDEALVFYHAPSIHTFFMRFPIDIVFLDKNMRVMKIYPALKPWKLAICLHSLLTLEFPPHKVSQTTTKVGDILELIPISAKDSLLP